MTFFTDGRERNCVEILRHTRNEPWIELARKYVGMYSAQMVRGIHDEFDIIPYNMHLLKEDDAILWYAPDQGLHILLYRDGQFHAHTPTGIFSEPVLATYPQHNGPRYIARPPKQKE